MFTHTLINIIMARHQYLRVRLLSSLSSQPPIMIISCDYVHMTRYQIYLGATLKLLSNQFTVEKGRYVLPKWFSCYPIKGIADLFPDDKPTYTLF